MTCWKPQWGISIWVFCVRFSVIVNVESCFGYYRIAQSNKKNACTAYTAIFTAALKMCVQKKEKVRVAWMRWQHSVCKHAHCTVKVIQCVCRALSFFCSFFMSAAMSFFITLHSAFRSIQADTLLYFASLCFALNSIHCREKNTISEKSKTNQTAEHRESTGFLLSCIWSLWFCCSNDILNSKFNIFVKTYFIYIKRIKVMK